MKPSKAWAVVDGLRIEEAGAVEVLRKTIQRESGS